MTKLLPQVPTISEGDTEIMGVDFTPILASDETLSSVTSATAVGDDSADLTVGSPAINSTSTTFKVGRPPNHVNYTVAANMGVTVTVSGQKAGTNKDYGIEFIVVTSKSRTLKRRANFDVD